MTFEQKLAVLLGAAIALAALVECLTRWAQRTVDSMVENGLADLAQMDDDWADPWTATPTFRNLCADNPGAVDALAAAEASRADWDEPARWAK